MKKIGRLVTCNRCNLSTARGTTQVRNKLVFHFCPACWLENRSGCNEWMLRVAGILLFVLVFCK